MQRNEWIPVGDVGKQLLLAGEQDPGGTIAEVLALRPSAMLKTLNGGRFGGMHLAEGCGDLGGGGNGVTYRFSFP